MFGYISINKAEMKFKDYDVYHSYYCGLCKVLKECYGRRGQVTLSFDMTFLVILLTGLYEPDTKTEMVRCHCTSQAKACRQRPMNLLNSRSHQHAVILL